MGFFNFFFQEMAPFVAMVVLETIVVGSNTINKAALSTGMSRYFLVFYSSTLAATVLILFSLFFQRGERPPVSFCILWKIFLVSFIGTTLNLEFLYGGLNYSSPTLASAMRNLVPAMTFVLAVIFRMENLNLRSSRSQMKIMATLLSMLGAIIVILYKGPSLFSFSSKTSMELKSSAPLFLSGLLVEQNNWAIGGILLACSSVSVAIWIISMGAILKEYPSEVNIMGFYSLFASIQSFAVSLVAERNHPNAWKISPDIQLGAIIYHAIVGTAIACCMEAWCIHKKGPLFVAMFKPLSIPIAALVAFIFLGEPLHIGTIIGGCIVIMGLYGVIWAKSKENEEQQQQELEEASSQLLLAVITTMQNCVLIGIKYSSPTLGSPMANLIPAMTFLLAVIFRMEKLNLRRSTSVIKMMGTLVPIAGALTITHYKGRPIGSQSFSTSYNAFPHIQEQITNNWVTGGLFLAIASFCVSVWYISQKAILKGYPSELTIVAFYCLFGSMQCAVVSLVAEGRHADGWKLRPDVQLVSVVYTAVCGNIITFGVHAWSIHKKGPVFVAMFKPFGMITTIVMTVIFLGDRLHVGTIIGAVIIIIGFYGVMWAQPKEEEQGDGKLDYLSSTSQNAPLLQNQDV